MVFDYLQELERKEKGKGKRNRLSESVCRLDSGNFSEGLNGFAQGVVAFKTRS